MEFNNFDGISFNYYVNTSSYVKTILDILPENIVSKQKKAIIIEIFNFILSGLSKEEISDVLQVSSMFNQKLEFESTKDIMMQLEYLYHNFLEKMIFDSYNRRIYFNIMNECVKVYAGYYEQYKNDIFNELNDKEIGNIHIR